MNLKILDNQVATLLHIKIPSASVGLCDDGEANIEIDRVRTNGVKILFELNYYHQRIICSSVAT